MHKNNKRIAAAVLSLALGFSAAGAGIFAPVAGAQISAGQASTVNMNADVTLNIEKYVGLPTDEGPINLPGLAGAQFTIEKIEGIDLTTYEGWNSIKDLDPTADEGEPGAISADRLADIATLTTDTNGHASISTGENNNFTVGVYLVTEKAPTGYTGAKPFIVTLPFTDGNGAWSYEQTVKPKNQMDEGDIKKTVDDLGATIGKEITYTISAAVPVGDLSQVIVNDNLQDGLSPATDVVVTYGDTTFDLGADYTVTNNETDGNELIVEFTADGRVKLQGLVETNAANKLEVEFKTTIQTLPTDDGGVIRNDASIDFGGGVKYTTKPAEGEDPDTGTETKLGKLTINKLNTEEELITGSAATFELWRCNLTDDNKYEVIGNSSLGSYETNPNTGIATQVVQVTNWVNNGTPDNGIGTDLCVVETKAPNDYTLNPEPQQVKLDDETADEYDMVVDVINLHTEDEAGGGLLPNTGGLGTMGLIAAGVVVAAAGGAASLRGNRSRA